MHILRGVPNAAPDTISSSTAPSGCNAGVGSPLDDDVETDAELGMPHLPKKLPFDEFVVIGVGAAMVDVVDWTRLRLGTDAFGVWKGVCAGVA